MTFPFRCHGSKDDTHGWLHGRFWINRRAAAKRARFTGLSLEWTIPMGHCGWSITFGGGDGGRNLSVTFAIPLLLTFYVTLENAFADAPFDMYDFDRGHDRQIGIYFHDWAVWYHIWVGSFASWSRGFAWCRWWRQGSFHFANLLGKQTYTTEELATGLPILVHMPEGVYAGTAKYVRSTWKRPLWFAQTRLYTDVKMPKGIPFAGKGENSWDCGDDGLFGYSAEGHDVAHAARRGREIVFKNRKRYGNPSAQAITEALA